MKASKTILFVIDNLGSGGAQNQAVLLALELKKRGYDIFFFTYYSQNFFKYRLDAAQIPVLFSPKKGKLGVGIIRSLIKTYRSVKPGLVISFLETPNFYSAISKKFFRGNIKLITCERSATDFSRKNIRLLTKQFSHKQADQIVTNSIHEKQAWEKYYPAFADKVSCIYNGVDLNRFTKKMQLDFTFKLLCIGSISPFKNGLFVIEILNILRNKFNLDISITWVGFRAEHIKRRESYFLEMEDRIKTYSLEKFWEWGEPTDEVISLMNSHDALLHAALVEGLPNVVCEALALGLPVFVSNILDHPHLVRDNLNGFLIPVNDPSTAATKIAHFYTMPKEKIESLSIEARNFASINLSIDKMVSEYINLFNSVNQR